MKQLKQEGAVNNTCLHLHSVRKWGRYIEYFWLRAKFAAFQIVRETRRRGDS